MLHINEIKDKLKDFNLSQVSKRTGVSYPTILKLANGNDALNYRSVKAVSDFLEGKECSLDHIKTN